MKETTDLPLNVAVTLTDACHVCPSFRLSAVYGSSEAASDASETSAGPRVPETRSPQEGPPLHLHPDPLLGYALDPHGHCGCHYFPCDGKRQSC